VTATTAMLKRLRFVFGMHRFIPTFGKILRNDMNYDYNDGPSVMGRQASSHSFHTTKNSTKVISIPFM